MNNSFIESDYLIFTPGDVDLSYSPLRNGLKEKTYVLGSFNPGLCRLPNGNLLMIVRVAEALLNPIVEDKVYCIRWDKEKGFVTDAWPLAGVTMRDPRQFRINSYRVTVLALTSLSWLLPVEIE
jgi:beta-1,2-mannobiose phosphorylase / 1,2-beta-oligomannan phosphorylase